MADIGQDAAAPEYVELALGEEWIWREALTLSPGTSKVSGSRGVTGDFDCGRFKSRVRAFSALPSIRGSDVVKQCYFSLGQKE